VKKLYVGNLPFKASEQDLQDLFSEAGFQVANISLIRDRYTNQLRGFGFVEIDNDDEALRAIQELNNKELLGRALTINEARPRREGGGGGGGGKGRGGGGQGRRREPRW
jgi:RNA recognition motif-containing protein